MKTDSCQQALNVFALPGLWWLAWWLSSVIGIPPGWLMQAAFIAWILLIHFADKAAEERKDAFYHQLSKQRQEIMEAQQTVAQVQAGEIVPPWGQ
jgi:hypothetical protein